jgi:succinate dehydrogenase / fumarate reductase cytochrome b subunit
VKEGVAPLRAGQGRSFFLRRLHSLTGIVPIGLFLIEHFVSNAFATKGPGAYTKQVEFLSSFPFVVGLELFGIWLPILYHSLYGFYIWGRSESNVTDYPWAGNWMYSAQRWTGRHPVSELHSGRGDAVAVPAAHQSGETGKEQGKNDHGRPR